MTYYQGPVRLVVTFQLNWKQKLALFFKKKETLIFKGNTLPDYMTSLGGVDLYTPRLLRNGLEVSIIAKEAA